MKFDFTFRNIFWPHNMENGYDNDDKYKTQMLMEIADTMDGNNWKKRSQVNIQIQYPRMWAAYEYFKHIYHSRVFSFI